MVGEGVIHGTRVGVVKVSVAASTHTKRPGTRVDWLTDTDCGVHMTSNPRLLMSVEPWNRGAAKVGSGDALRATGRGLLKPLVVRNDKGDQVVIFLKRRAWLVPGCVFDILSVGELKRERIGLRTGEVEGRLADYLILHDSGHRVPIVMHGGIYLLRTIQHANMAPQVRALVQGAVQKTKPYTYTRVKHISKELWFVFDVIDIPTAAIRVVAGEPGPGDDSHRAAVHQTSGSLQQPKITVGDVISAGEVVLGDELEWNATFANMSEADHSAFCVAFATLASIGKLPQMADSTSGVSAKALLDFVGLGSGVSSPQEAERHMRGLTLSCPILPGMQVPDHSCSHPGCENAGCVYTLCNAVNRSSVSKGSPFYLAQSDVTLQHARWGDADPMTLYNMCKHGRIRGVNIKHPPSRRMQCKVCDMVNNQKSGIRSVPKHLDQILYEDKQNSSSMDAIGPIKASRWGHRFAHLLTYYGCRKGSSRVPVRYVFAYPVRSLDGRKTQECIEHSLWYLDSHFDIKVTHIHFDNAAYYKSPEVRESQREWSPRWFATYAPKYTPIKNRHAEKTNHLIVLMALRFMVRGGAPAWAWPLALIYAAYCYNRIGSNRGKDPSPLELASGVVPDGSMLRVFWSPCYPLLHKEQGRGKFEPRSRGSLNQPCRFCGICDAAPAFYPGIELSWLYWDPLRVKVDHSAHMRFDEGDHMATTMPNLAPHGAGEAEEGSSIRALADELGLDRNSGLDAASAGLPAPGGETPRGAEPDEGAGNPAEDEEEKEEEAHVEPGFSTLDSRPQGPVASRPRGPAAPAASPATKGTPDQTEGGRPYPRRPEEAQGGPSETEPEGAGRREGAREKRTIVRFRPDAPNLEHQADHLEHNPAREEAIRLLGGVPQGSQAPVSSVITTLIAVVQSMVEPVRDRLAFMQAASFAEDLISETAASITVHDQIPDPKTYSEARRSQDWTEWYGAINTEVEALIALGTWQVLPGRHAIPKGKNIVRSKGVFKKKFLETGELDKYKYRLVGCGYSQVEGVDFFETSASVVSIVVVRIFCCIIAALDLKTRLYDIGNAFLEGDLQEEIYMKLPDYVLDGAYVRLRKALYGLKQAGRIFVELLAKFLLELGFVRSKTEPCLFTLICTEFKGKRIADIASDLDDKWNGVGYITTLTYVDDEPAAANTVVLLDWLGESLEHRFRKVTCTSFRWFIGFRIIVESGRVSMDQEQYAELLISKFEKYFEHPMFKGYFYTTNGRKRRFSTPAEPGQVLSKSMCPQTEAEQEAIGFFPYPSLVGGLLWLANGTRIDILTATSGCAKFMSNFGAPHAIAALQVIAYLTNDKGRKWIARKAAKPQDNLRLYFDADSSYADCPDTGRSRWGVTGSINDTYIDAGSGMFPNVRPSTFAAETGALAKATLRVLTARRYMADFGFPQQGPVPIGEDNNAALLFSKSPVATRTSRHIHVDHHVTRENQQEFKTIEVYRVPSSEMTADMLSKNLPPHLLQKHSSKLMGECKAAVTSGALMPTWDMQWPAPYGPAPGASVMHQQHL